MDWDWHYINSTISIRKWFILKKPGFGLFSPSPSNGWTKLRLIQRQDDSDSRSDVGNENRSQQADKPREVAVDSIFDIRKAVVYVVQSVVDSIQSVADLFDNRFQGGDSAFNGGDVHKLSFLRAIGGQCMTATCV